MGKSQKHNAGEGTASCRIIWTNRYHLYKVMKYKMAFF